MTNHQFFTQQCAAEHPRFVGVLEATPPHHLEYRPHPRSRSAQELIGHLIGHEQDLVELCQTGAINHRMHVPFTDLGDAIRIYRQAHDELTSALAALDENIWESTGSFILGGKTLMEAPRRDLAWMMLLDAVHHRGQLSTYLRPMGGKVPAIYGPSADTMPGQA